MLKTKSLPILAGTTALGLSLFVVAPANATPVPPSETFTFTSDHCTGGCLTGQTNGGSVTVTDNGSGVLGFSVSLANGNQFINTGFDVSFGFQLAGISSVSFSSTTPSGTSAPGFFIPGTTSGNGTENANPCKQGQNTNAPCMMDGVGTFNFGLEGAGSGSSSPDGSTLSFDISASGLTLSSLVGNANGQIFGADIASGTTPTGCTIAAGTCNTGGIDVSVPAPVIGHGMLVLLAIGGVLFGGKLLESFKKRQLQAA